MTSESIYRYVSDAASLDTVCAMRYNLISDPREAMQRFAFPQAPRLRLGNASKRARRPGAAGRGAGAQAVQGGATQNVSTVSDIRCTHYHLEEDDMSPTLSRRDLLKLSGAALATGALAACAPPVTPAPAVEEKPAAPAVPAAPGVPTPRAMVPRENTLIIGFEGGPVQAPANANPYAPGTAINQGYHQLMIESLFYLNYESGEQMPWLAESFSFNDDYTEVTIKLRP
ncbi:MAG: twin-arginine translocation signal domain-containing protein, partial [Chloroflexi bacterium]|nr:twin-arginine translocation signal domain-containing protein [Chloroflexota bacterium]